MKYYEINESFDCVREVPKSRLEAYVSVEIGDVFQRVKVKNLMHPTLLGMAVSLTDGRHRDKVNFIVGKIGRTKVRVYGLGKK